MYNKVQLNDRADNWAASIKMLLLSLGFGEVWYRQGVFNKTAFFIICKQRLKDQYIQKWFGNLGVNSGCVLYRVIKCKFVDSPHLRVAMSLKYKIALTRFRTRNHKLPVVQLGRGRNRLPYAERLCSTCSKLGDEYHWVFECQQTHHLRHILPKYYRNRPNMFKFTELLQSEQPSVIRKFAKFVYLTEC